MTPNQSNPQSNNHYATIAPNQQHHRQHHHSHNHHLHHNPNRLFATPSPSVITPNASRRHIQLQRQQRNSDSASIQPSEQKQQKRDDHERLMPLLTRQETLLVAHPNANRPMIQPVALPTALACKKKNLHKMMGFSPSDIDKYSRIFFPLSFICFNLMYWIIYMHVSNEIAEDLIMLHPPELDK